MDNRYYFDDIENNRVVIKGNQAQHLLRVRRAKLGDEIMAFNGNGYDYKLKISEIAKDKAECEILAKTLNKAMNDCDITVYLAMIKNEALVEAIDHLAELNVKHVKLFKSEYSVAVVDQKKLEKLKTISIEASKQSERADVMQISIIEKNKIKDDVKQIDNVFFAYENSNNKIEKFNGNFAVIIGSEGGFSQTENEYFSSFAKNISLSNTILRAEVAGVCAVSMLKAVQNVG